MPIYAYKCGACGHAKDVLQKISDDPLTECPACHAAAFSKQLTAAGFQLKGSGWYVTDFKGGANAPSPASTEGGASNASAVSSTETSGGTSSGDASSGAPASTMSGTSSGASSTASASASTSTTSAVACGASCACH